MNAVLVTTLDWQPMCAGDIDAVMAVENRIYPFPWTAGNFLDSLDSGYSAWTCRENGVLVAYAVMTLAVDEAQLLTIGVAAERQRTGLGGELLAHLFAVARQMAARRMFLEVRPSNEPALGLYRRHGFAEIGRRKGYYPAANNSREDAIVMGRDL